MKKSKPESIVSRSIIAELWSDEVIAAYAANLHISKLMRKPTKFLRKLNRSSEYAWIVLFGITCGLLGGVLVTYLS